MTRYNNNRFTPGNKGNLRLFINKLYIKHTNNNADAIAEEILCGCIQQRTNNIKQGWNDPSETQNNRVSRIITGSLGGRTTFGNVNTYDPIHYLGGWEGQPGGMPRPLRNKF